MCYDKSEGNRDLTNREYNRDYYEKNRDRISRQRSERYRSDPGFREQKRAAERARYKKNVEVPEPDNRRSLRQRFLLVDGVEIAIHSMGALSGALGVSDESVKFWELRGVIPKPVMVDNARRRWYTEKFIKGLSRCWSAWNLVGKPGGLDRFRELVLNGCAETLEVKNAGDGLSKEQGAKGKRVLGSDGFEMGNRHVDLGSGK